VHSKTKHYSDLLLSPLQTNGTGIHYWSNIICTENQKDPVYRSWSQEWAIVRELLVLAHEVLAAQPQSAPE
jgi:hypothetical protein